MVLAVMRDYNLGKLKFKYAKEILESIEHFHYIFNAITSQRSSGGIATMYSTYARKVSSASDDSSKLAVIRECRQKMREKIPTYDEFFAAFKTLRFTNGYTKQKKIIQYTLAKFDSFYNKNGVSINYDLMTLEHILPQNSNSKSPNHDVYVGQIGNLILVDEQMNNALGRKSFVDKKSILTSANIHIDNIISSANDWTSVEIEARTTDIAMKAFNTVFAI